ncbi:MAG TPA: NAD(P)H-dependent oxidoreductase subunit E [Syntrophales bacterium]|nr:NAD(P)H-dependent oxidoreductase subunit E [Syntrophales bacterium]
MYADSIHDIIQESGNGNGGLIAILEEIQKEYTYLPETVLKLVAKETGQSLRDIYGVATFYKAFSLTPKGKHCVSVCLGTACHVRGGQQIANEFSQQLGISPGETSPDREFTLETVNCLGACALGPVVMVDGHYFPHVTKGRVREIISETRNGQGNSNVHADSRIFPLQVSCPTCKENLMNPDCPIDGHPSIKVNISCNGTKDQLNLSSLYGSQTTALEHPVPANSIFKFYCPHCLNEVPSFSSCKECGAPMAALFVREGCAWEICTREGCKGRLLNLDQVNMRK